MLLNVIPRPTAMDVADRPSGNSVFPSQDVLLFTQRQSGPNLSYFNLRKFGYGRLVTFELAILLYLVKHVIPVRTQEKVTDVSAGRIVTRMQDLHPRWDGAVGYNPSNNMRSALRINPSDQAIRRSITFSLPSTLPLMAGIITARRIKSSQEPFHWINIRRISLLKWSQRTSLFLLAIMPAAESSRLMLTGAAVEGTDSARLAHGIDSLIVGSSGRRSVSAGRRLRPVYRKVA